MERVDVDASDASVRWDPSEQLFEPLLWPFAKASRIRSAVAAFLLQ